MDDHKVFKSDESSDANYFHLDGTLGDEIWFSIQQPKDIIRVVGVLSRMDIGTEHLDKLRAFDQKKRDEFFRDLSKNLVFLVPNFGFEPTPKNPEWIFFVKEISYDELTEGRLNAAVNQICRNVIFTSSYFDEVLGEPEKR